MRVDGDGSEELMLTLTNIQHWSLEMQGRYRHLKYQVKWHGRSAKDMGVEFEVNSLAYGQ
jgi:hypothetical protein